MNRTDILLAIIAAAEGEPLQPVHLQKVAFLVGQEFERELPEDYYAFDKYRYGPFSAIIYADADLLEYWGQIEIRWHAQPSKKEYAVVDRHVIEDLGIPERILTYIRETVAWAARQSFQELVRSIYYLYPEYQENSIFHYSADEALTESIIRGINDYKEGRVYPAREWLEKMRSELEADSNAHSQK